ncbi:hypothetical protein H0H93_013260, partial [Arthromyces matolae]
MKRHKCTSGDKCGVEPDVVGLLPKDNEQQIPFAYKLYKRQDKTGLNLCSGFKQTFCQDVKVEFVGVWDTVASVGIIAGRTLPFTNSNKAIKTFRHALALDERRAKFRPNFYHRPPPRNLLAEKRRRDDSPPIGSFRSAKGLLSSIKARGSIFKKEFQMLFTEPEPDDDGIPDTDVLEVWFSGCHGDVGGGTVPDSEMRSLANVSLRWMVREVQLAICGILFDDRALDRVGIPRMVSETDSITKLEVMAVPEREAEIEGELDNKDAIQPLYDQLVVGNKLWWLLEIMPL